MSNRLRNIAIRRLKRDLIELEKEGLLSVSAAPLDNNIFEWHVNIKPTDGVYSGVYFHLIMVFPESYPSNPPTVKICTPIRHPNIFDSFLCLSMLRSYTGNVPYEGWSGAYSVTSILMQLQSFLFAEKIDQDGGYQANARLSDRDVNHSIKICKTFECKGNNGCGHSHSTPWPKVTGPPEALIKVFPTDPKSGHVVVQGSSCQTTHTYWVGAYGEFGCNYGKVFYEAFINWTGDKWRKDNIRGGLCRFGFGSEYASVCGRDTESFGYGGTGMFSYNNQFTKFGESFTKDDTITVAVDFNTMRIFFAKNGIIQEPNSKYYVPEYLQGALLFPILSFKNSRAEFNFGEAKRPCKWLINQGFKTLEQVAKEQDSFDGEKEENKDEDDKKDDEKKKVDWHSHMIINELWLSIFESLTVPEIYGTQFICRKWYNLINKYNIIERNEIYCYYTKGRMGQDEGGRILGIGLNIKPSPKGWGVTINSQMDILSLNAWKNGCRIGVWGEPLTHFLPLAMNKTHSQLADKWIIQFLQEISIVVTGKRISSHQSIQNEALLKLVDTLITMMNKIVVQFVMGNENTNSKKVSMVMCEKVVLGYCALHHLLLYLTSKNKKFIHNFANKKASDFINKKNGCNKTVCKDLGKFLIYLLIATQYSWNDVADIFVKEAFTRQVRWIVQDQKYAKYDTTKQIPGRMQDTFSATKISRRLIMFQVWFMQNNANETLKGYNDRLGRPTSTMRLGIVNKTKEIINSNNYWQFFNSLGLTVKNDQAIDQILRFAVWDSKQKGYHTENYYGAGIEKIDPPKITVIVRGKDYNNAKTASAQEGQQVGLKINGNGRGYGNLRGGGTSMVQRGRGRGGGIMSNNGNNYNDGNNGWVQSRPDTQQQMVMQPGGNNNNVMYQYRPHPQQQIQPQLYPQQMYPQQLYPQQLYPQQWQSQFGHNNGNYMHQQQAAYGNNVFNARRTGNDSYNNNNNNGGQPQIPPQTYVQTPTNTNYINNRMQQHPGGINIYNGRQQRPIQQPPLRQSQRQIGDNNNGNNSTRRQQGGNNNYNNNNRQRW